MERPKTMRSWSPASFRELVAKHKVSYPEISYWLGCEGLSYTVEGIKYWREDRSKGPPHPLVVKLLVDLFVERGEPRAATQKALVPPI